MAQVIVPAAHVLTVIAASVIWTRVSGGIRSAVGHFIRADSAYM